MMFPPRLSFTKIQNANSVNGNLTLSATATDETGVAGVKYLLDGVQIGSEVTKSPYTFVWDSTSAPNGLHTVMAVARDAGGNWNGASQTIVVSNATVDCPGAVTPHTHDPRWLDVDANKWNSTGLVLKPGQQIRVTVMPGAADRLASRPAGRRRDSAPAQGDPRVNPGNTMFWLDPQIKGVAIGALIGGLWDEPSTRGATMSSKPGNSGLIARRVISFGVGTAAIAFRASVDRLGAAWRRTRRCSASAGAIAGRRQVVVAYSISW